LTLLIGWLRCELRLTFATYVDRTSSHSGAIPRPAEDMEEGGC